MDIKRRITIVCGHYGSGKTEFSINLALKMAQNNYKIALVDLDVVNVAFRSRELRDYLSDKNIQVISTAFNTETSDIPSISAKAKLPLNDKSYYGIYDLGGNSEGSRSFVQFSGLLDINDYDLMFVCNANRMETSDSNKALQQFKRIESTLGLKITKIVNNTHLISETTFEDVEKGNKVSLELSEKAGVPLKYVVGTKEILQNVNIPNGAKKFEMDLLMRKKWMNIR